MILSINSKNDINMKQLNTKYSIACATLLLVFFVASCDQAEDPASTISTEDYPTVTVTSDLEGNTVAEGDTVNFEISLDRPPENIIPFDLMISGEELSPDDYTVSSVAYPAFGTEPVTVQVVFNQDNLPENEEISFSYKLAITDVGVRELVNPNSQLPSGNLTLVNRNNPNGLTVVLDWNTDADMDLFYVLYQGGTPVALNQDGATGAKPETIIDDTGTPGTFYYSINPYAYEQAAIDYTFRIGYPDQSVEFIDGSFDADAVTAGTGVLAPEPVLGAAYGRALKVTSTTNASGANSFEVEDLNSDDSDN
jgi:hypothetical protein